MRLGYTAICTLFGLVLGWLPMLVHGPIPQKFDVLFIRGSITVWGFYLARLLIGFMVLREPFTWMKLFAVGLIATGIFLLQREGL